MRTATFVPSLVGDGVLHLPRAVADTLPAQEPDWPDELLLALPADAIGRADDATVVAGLHAVRRQRARVEAQEARLVARLAAIRGGDRYVPDEVGLELRISRQAAQGRVYRSVTLVTKLPGVLAAMDDGEIEGYTAGRLADLALDLSDDDARAVDERFTARYRAGKLRVDDPTALRRQMARMVARVDPDAAATRAKRARCGRRVELIPGADSMSTLIGDLPAEVAAAAYARIDRDARRLRNSGDPRTLDQLRADVFAQLLTTGGDGTASTKTVVYLHMPVTTALGMTDDGCELTGYGPIPGPIARDIMTNPQSVLRKVLEDPTSGEITGLGRRRYRPNAALRDLIAVRDKECGYCHRPAHACDTDHLQEWGRDRGPTDPDNLGPACEHHHYLKDHPDWELEHDPVAGTTTITTPAGRKHVKKREQIVEPPDPEPPPKIELPDDPPF